MKKRAEMVMQRGEMVLLDPEAVAAIRAVNKYNCRFLLEANAERVEYFTRRIAEREDDPRDVMIVVLNVDDRLGGLFADELMPGHDWQSYRDRGELPVARGLAGRRSITDVLTTLDADSASELRAIDGMAVMVVDHGVVAIFSAPVEPGARRGEDGGTP